MRKLKRIHVVMLAVFLCAAALFAGGFFYGQYNYPEAKARRAAYGYLEEAGRLPEDTEIRPESGVVYTHIPPGFSAPEGVPSLVVQFEGVLNVWLDPESLELLRIGNG